MLLSGKIFLAAALDFVVGDPPRLPHPVILIGKLISALENLLYRPGRSAVAQQLAGALLVFFVVGVAYALTWLLLLFAYAGHYWLGLMLEVWLISTTLAARSLAQAARQVLKPLCRGDMLEARRMLGYIVGRQTGGLPPSEIVRATVETVAENTSDGFVAPLFYALLGGAPLAMAYKAVNTLDSMLGYKNERYLYFGRPAARLDDIANFVPARLTGLLLVLAAWWSGRRARLAWLTMRRDARRHPSPNSGYPEAAVAGALGVRLGGHNYYHGRVSFRPYLGREIYPLQPGHIRAAVDLMYLAAAFGVLLGCGLRYLLGG
ncbi:adenosylcobinamide-phosphate synthase CbiB [Desulfurispora thermophila]|uniref:adenosylcobinamide-phosphate synthase CbiB n=1 Tax=Desulfurispora thermophila TaxID=265470 RepID=UPI0003686801|nr:adenosylcobinamide-phosphate synthase CbiB [Desulfurispora thermophila]